MLVLMGSGAETARETAAALNARGERVGVVQVRLYRPFPAEALVDALPATRAQVAVLDRTKEPGSIGRAALPRRGRRAGRAADGERADADGHRRPLRALLEGVHAGHGRRRVRRARAGAAAAPLHDRHQRRRLRHEPRLRRGARHRAARDGARDLLRPRLGRHGRREQEHDQDPRRRGGPARAGLLRLRLEEVRLADRLAPALRAAADPGAVPRAAGELRRLPPVRPARPGRRARPRGARRDAAAQLPAPAGRGLGRAVAPGAGADPRQAHRRCTRSTPAGSRARSASPAAPTSCSRPASSRVSGVLPREEAIERIKAAIEKTYGRRGAEVVRAQPGGGRPRARRAAPGRGARAGDRRRASRRRVVPAHAPEFVRTVTAAMLAGRGDDLPVSALPVDGTYPSGTAAYEKRNISELVAVWDPDLCIQCGNCSFVCPHSVIRSRYYDESHLDGAPDGFQSAPLDAVGLPDTRYTLQVYVEDCTGCELCVEACPVVGARRPGPQGDQPRRARAARRGRAREHRVLRDAARERPRRGSTSARCAAPSSWSRCSSSPARAPAAARRRT